MLVGTIFHEHLCHHSVLPLVQFLGRAGLELIHVERVSIQGGSLICHAQHQSGKRVVRPSVQQFLTAEQQANLHSKASMQAFVRRFETMKAQVREIVEAFAQRQGTIVGYGAARSGPMLITQFELAEYLSGVYDDHPQKVGLYTPGHHQLVRPTAELEQQQPELAVILAWVHAKAIVAKHKNYLKNGGGFLTLTPTIELITQENYERFIA